MPQSDDKKKLFGVNASFQFCYSTHNDNFIKVVLRFLNNYYLFHAQKIQSMEINF